MVSLWRINYPFQKGGISLLKFVPGIWVWMRSLQFGSRCKYQSRLFECRKHVAYTTGCLNNKQQLTQESQREMRLVSETNAAKRKRSFSKYLEEYRNDYRIVTNIVKYRWIKFIELWIKSLSTTVFLFDSSHKIFHSITHVTHLTRLIQSPVKHLRWGF